MASDKGYSMFLTRLSAELRNWAATTWIWVLGQANHDLEFMLHKLRQNELELGKTMCRSLSYRVEQHRNAKVSGLIHFPSGEEISNSFLSDPSQAEIIKFSRNIGCFLKRFSINVKRKCKKK